MSSVRGIEGVNPGSDNVAVRFALGIVESVAGNHARLLQNLVADGVGIRVDRDLIVVLAQRSQRSGIGCSGS